MATVKKGVLTNSSEWARHLRKDGKRYFWSKERIAEKKVLRHDNNLEYITRKIEEK